MGMLNSGLMGRMGGAYILLPDGTRLRGYTALSQPETSGHLLIGTNLGFYSTDRSYAHDQRRGGARGKFDPAGRRIRQRRLRAGHGHVLSTIPLQRQIRRREPLPNWQP